MVTKYKIETLDNGLTFVFIKTDKKYAKSASIYVKFGGFNKKVQIDNKNIKVIDGTAHFIEHLLIEKSKYGNMILEFKNNNVNTNGITYNDKTEYYITTVDNFEENLVKLINMVNVPAFNEKDIDEIKPAIIQEKLERNDDKYYDFYTKYYESLFYELKNPNVLGNIDDIKNMKYNYIKKIYDAFYDYTNQIIVVNGNINYQKIKKLVIDTYNKINKNKINYNIPNYNLTDKIKDREVIIKKDIENELTNIIFKQNITKLKPIERLKFDWYSGIYLKYFLGEVENKITKISSNSVGYIPQIIENYYNIQFLLQTNKHREFLKLLTDNFKKIKVPKEEFEIIKKRDLIRIIEREESKYNQVQPLVDNILLFNYMGMDTYDFIDSLNYNEFERYINKLDFNNYLIVKLIKNK